MPPSGNALSANVFPEATVFSCPHNRGVSEMDVQRTLIGYGKPLIPILANPVPGKRHRRSPAGGNVASSGRENPSNPVLLRSHAAARRKSQSPSS